MDESLEYGPRERFWLWSLAAFGFVALNGPFLYGVFVRPEALRTALGNPVAMAFMVEAFLMLAALAYLLTRWGVTRLSWRWFVGLSLLGGMAFALPVVLLWRGGDDRTDAPRAG